MTSRPKYLSGCAKRKLKVEKEEQTKKLAGSLDRYMKPKVSVVSNIPTYDNANISK